MSSLSRRRRKWGVYLYYVKLAHKEAPNMFYTNSPEKEFLAELNSVAIHLNAYMDKLNDLALHGKTLTDKKKQLADKNKRMKSKISQSHELKNHSKTVSKNMIELGKDVKRKRKANLDYHGAKYVHANMVQHFESNKSHFLRLKNDIENIQSERENIIVEMRNLQSQMKLIPHVLKDDEKLIVKKIQYMLDLLDDVLLKYYQRYNQRQITKKEYKKMKEYRRYLKRLAKFKRRKKYVHPLARFKKVMSALKHEPTFKTPPEQKRPPKHLRNIHQEKAPENFKQP